MSRNPALAQPLLSADQPHASPQRAGAAAAAASSGSQLPPVRARKTSSQAPSTPRRTNSIQAEQVAPPVVISQRLDVDDSAFGDGSFSFGAGSPSASPSYGQHGASFGQPQQSPHGLRTPVPIDLSPPTPAFPVSRATTTIVEESEVFPLSAARWWMLAVFALLSSNQSMLWLTFSPLAKSTEQYYSISSSQTALLLNWGPLIFLPVVIPVAHFSASNRGMRNLLSLSAWLQFVACALRLVPEAPHVWTPGALDSEGRPTDTWLGHHSYYSPYFLHAAQILNAAAGPILVATVAKVSCTWFSAQERTGATAALTTCGASLGSALGFLLSPVFVPESHPELIPRYLSVQGCFATLALLMTLIYLPIQPRFYPSVAAREMDLAAQQQKHSVAVVDTQSSIGSHSTGMSRGLSGAGITVMGGGAATMKSASAAHMPFSRAVSLALRNPNLVLLCLSNGLINGLWNVWTGSLSSILVNLSQASCAWLSFGATMAQGGSAVIVGQMASRWHGWRRGLKLICLVSSLLLTLTLLWLSASTPNWFDNSSSSDGGGWLPASQALLIVIVCLAGLAIGSAGPVAFELCAELSYPLGEGVSGGLLSAINNAAGVVFLFAAPNVSGATANAMMLLTGAVCTLLLLPVKEEYRRSDEEAAVAAGGSAGASRARQKLFGSADEEDDDESDSVDLAADEAATLAALQQETDAIAARFQLLESAAERGFKQNARNGNATAPSPAAANSASRVSTGTLQRTNH